MGVLHYWALICEEPNGGLNFKLLGHSFGGECIIGSKQLDPHLGECNGSPNYWALIWALIWELLGTHLGVNLP
jgi:hypothetical protein